jgi:hypothetical protein
MEQASPIRRFSSRRQKLAQSFLKSVPEIRTGHQLFAGLFLWSWALAQAWASVCQVKRLGQGTPESVSTNMLTKEEFPARV